jgi:hypothetical protein
MSFSFQNFSSTKEFAAPTTHATGEDDACRVACVAPPMYDFASEKRLSEGVWASGVPPTCAQRVLQIKLNPRMIPAILAV